MSEATTARDENWLNNYRLEVKAKRTTRVIRLEVNVDEEWLTHDGEDTSEQAISESWVELETRIKSAMDKEFYWGMQAEISIIEWEDDEEVIND